MTLTPSATSGLAAGAGFWTLVWTMLFKVDKIPGLNRFVTRDGILRWVQQNKTLALLCTEIINVGMHGVSNPNITSFVLGGTAANAIFIYAFVPIVNRLSSRRRVIL